MKTFLLLLFVVIAWPAFAGMDDDPLLAALSVDQLEWREDDGLVWDVEAWVGRDRDKLWFETEGERNDGTTEDFETRLFYHRAVTPYWNVRAGWRGDWQPESRRSWFAFGVAGLAPGFIETELTAYVADGRTALNLILEYELFLSQRLSLAPKLETDWYSDADPANERGDGVTGLELSARLLYAATLNIRPYLGVAYTASYGETGDIVEAAGDRDRDLQVLIGLNAAF